MGLKKIRSRRIRMDGYDRSYRRETTVPSVGLELGDCCNRLQEHSKYWPLYRAIACLQPTGVCSSFDRRRATRLDAYQSLAGDCLWRGSDASASDLLHMRLSARVNSVAVIKRQTCTPRHRQIRYSQRRYRWPLFYGEYS